MKPTQNTTWTPSTTNPTYAAPTYTNQPLVDNPIHPPPEHKGLMKDLGKEITHPPELHHTPLPASATGLTQPVLNAPLNAPLPDQQKRPLGSVPDRQAGTNFGTTSNMKQSEIDFQKAEQERKLQQDIKNQRKTAQNLNDAKSKLADKFGAETPAKTETPGMLEEIKHGIKGAAYEAKAKIEDMAGH